MTKSEKLKQIESQLVELGWVVVDRLDGTLLAADAPWPDCTVGAYVTAEWMQPFDTIYDAKLCLIEWDDLMVPVPPSPRAARALLEYIN